MSIAISILGLALLILVHEAGHFFASLAVGLRPRRFYVGFPPAIAKTNRNGIEYAIGAIPLGGFVGTGGNGPDRCLVLGAWCLVRVPGAPLLPIPDSQVPTVRRRSR